MHVWAVAKGVAVAPKTLRDLCPMAAGSEDNRCSCPSRSIVKIGSEIKIILSYGILTLVALARYHIHVDRKTRPCFEITLPTELLTTLMRSAEFLDFCESLGVKVREASYQSQYFCRQQ